MLGEFVPSVHPLRGDLADVAAQRVGEQAREKEHLLAVMQNARFALDRGEVDRAKRLLDNVLREPMR